MYVVFLLFPSVDDSKVELRELVKKILRCCIYIDVTPVLQTMTKFVISTLSTNKRNLVKNFIQ